MPGTAPSQPSIARAGGLGGPGWRLCGRVPGGQPGRMAAGRSNPRDAGGPGSSALCPSAPRRRRASGGGVPSARPGPRRSGLASSSPEGVAPGSALGAGGGAPRGSAGPTRAPGDVGPPRVHDVPVFSVDRPGLYTTVQDDGRIGFGHLGVPRAGPADPSSFRLANILVGNQPGAAALEVTGVGPELVCQSDTFVAVVGPSAGSEPSEASDAGTGVLLDGRWVPTGSVCRWPPASAWP